MFVVPGGSSPVLAPHLGPISSISVGASTSFPRPKEDPRAEILRLERRIAADVQAAFIDNSNTSTEAAWSARAPDHRQQVVDSPGSSSPSASASSSAPRPFCQRYLRILPILDQGMQELIQNPIFENRRAGRPPRQNGPAPPPRTTISAGECGSEEVESSLFLPFRQTPEQLDARSLARRRHLHTRNEHKLRRFGSTAVAARGTTRSGTATTTKNSDLETAWHVYLDLFERLRECLELSVKAEDAALQEKSGDRGRLLEEIEHERGRGAIVARVSQMEKKYGDEVKLLEQARFQEMQSVLLLSQHHLEEEKQNLRKLRAVYETWFPCISKLAHPSKLAAHGFSLRLARTSTRAGAQPGRLEEEDDVAKSVAQVVAAMDLDSEEEVVEDAAEQKFSVETLAEDLQRLLTAMNSRGAN